MDMFYGGHGWGMNGGMGFLTILFWFVIIIGALYIAKGLLPSKSDPIPPPPGDSAIDILKKRFARGEIDEETFRRMKEQLEDIGS